MKLNVAAFLLGLLLVGSIASTVEAKERPERSCHQCGTIQAVLPRIQSFGHSGFYTYDLIVKMDQSGLIRRVPVTTIGPMDVGDRVSLMGGTVTPVL